MITDHAFRAGQAWQRAAIPDVVVTGCVLTGAAGVGKTTVLESLRDRIGGPVVAVSGVRRTAELVFGHLPGLRTAPPADSSQSLRWAVAREFGDGRARALIVDDAHLLDDDAASIVHSLAVHDGIPMYVAYTTSRGRRARAAMRSLWKDGHLPRYELSPMSEVEVREYLEFAVRAPVTSRDVDSFTRWSRGEPGVLVELVAASDGQWRTVNGVAILATRPTPPPALIEELEAAVAELSEREREVVEAFAAAGPEIGGRLLDQLPLSPMIDYCGMDTLLEAERGGVIVVEGDRVRLSVPFLADAVANGTPALRRSLVAEELARSVRVARMAGSPADPTALEQAVTGLLTAQSHAGVGPVRTVELARSVLRLGDPTMVCDVAAPRGAAPENSALAALYTWALTDLNDVPRIMEMLETWKSDQSPAWRGIVDFYAAYGTRRARGAKEFITKHDTTDGGVVGSALRWIDRDRLSGVWFAFLLAETAMMVGRYDDARRLLDAASPEADDNGLLVFDLAMIDVHLETVVAGAGRACERAENARRESWWRSDHACAAADYVCASAHVSAGRFAQAKDELRDSAPFVAGPALDGAPARLMKLIDRMSTGQPSPEVEATVDVLDDTVDPYAVVRVRDATIVRAWAAATADEMSDAVDALLDAGATIVEHTPTIAVDLLELAARFVTPGDPRIQRLETIISLVADSVEPAAQVDALIDYCTALSDTDGAGLCEAASRYERLGHLPVAADAFAHAVAAHQVNGDARRAAAARSAAQNLVRTVGGLTSPAQRAIAAPVLTRREREIVGLAAEALSNQQIAERVSLSVRTVEGHVLRASAKLGVQDRHALVAAWQELQT
ncbi:regulatory protein, luxR family [Gordonia malaquae]|uniref:Putative LuxR family transcriptional regulator n=1 Tax=Gordonia malaquae NBRC 108250 TaxID=1223542 RepID=M3UVX7_GORML|nr:helix-turn-helix transcriptional regulator [Gordonia malaquae]GAC79732.1 putative LuxR family transcriptional regulator [Gordonia malaquae NBRC 108250]SEC39965.1 regulatory protein, luxR family [Gordonia malaquae]